MATVSVFQQTNMAPVTSWTRLFNINNIQDGHRFFVWMNQYGRYVMQKTTFNINKSNMAAFSLFQ